jgi:autotransporter passenger strand-loop-strand repeat protein
MQRVRTGAVVEDTIINKDGMQIVFSGGMVEGNVVNKEGVQVLYGGQVAGTILNRVVQIFASKGCTQLSMKAAHKLFLLIALQ